MGTETGTSEVSTAVDPDWWADDAMDARAAFARDVDREAHNLRVREAAREKVDAEKVEAAPGFDAGTLAEVLARPGMAYEFAGTDMEYGAIRTKVISGKTDVGYLNAFHWDTGWVAVGWTDRIDVALSGLFATAVGDGSSPAGGKNRVGLRVGRTGGATTIADNTTYSAFRPADLAVIGRRMSVNGALLSYPTQSSNNPTVSEVVTDVFGRMLLLICDPVAAAITVSSTAIDQLVYRQAVTARTVLDDLALWEPDHLWEILHTTNAGKHVFNYRAWPTGARYEITTKDGYSKPGTDSGLCNRLVVNYTDATGVPKAYTATATVAALGTRIRHADPITLPPGRGSATDAAAIGADVLADLNAGASAASAVVRRRIPDLLTGNIVEPWEIEPGYLVRVRETGDLLRLSEVTYSWSEDGASAATLSLGRPRLTVEQRVARLDRVA